MGAHMHLLSHALVMLNSFVHGAQVVGIEFSRHPS